MTNNKFTVAAIAIFGCGLLVCGNVHALSDDFSTDPLADGSVWTVTGTNQSALADGTPAPAFDWSSGTLTVNYNSTQPTSRLSVPLGVTLTNTDTFSFSAFFTIRSENYAADPNGYMGILNFALVNAATTGLERTGRPPADSAVDVFDNVEATYWPNVAAWGGPYVGPTVFGANSGSDDGFSNFASWFGAEAQQKTLPLDTPLEMTINHDPADKTVSLTIQVVGGSTILDAVPLDVSTLSPSFTVDSFAITMYNDGWSAVDPPSAVATVDFESIYVTATTPQAEPENTPAGTTIGLSALVAIFAASATRRLSK